MKQYVCMPLVWLDCQDDWSSDYDNEERFSSYAKAVKRAKELNSKFKRVEVIFYNISRSDFKYEDDYQEAWDDPNNWIWRELFEESKQIPASMDGDTPIWRWGGFGCKDLKPRKL